MLKSTIVISSLAFAGLLAAAGTTATKYIFLYSAGSKTPIMQLTAPKGTASCSTRTVRLTVAATAPIQAQTCIGDRCSPTDPNSLSFRDRVGRVLSSAIRLGSGDPGSASPPEPVTGTDKLEYLCREDEEAGQCVCIPFVHRDEK